MKKNVNNKRAQNSTELTMCQKEAIRLFKSGSNVFLSGEAGTGKSFVLNEFLSSVEDKSVMVCAPTGIAALNIGGVTLHRAFSIPCRPLGPKDRPETVSKELLRTDCHPSNSEQMVSSDYSASIMHGKCVMVKQNAAVPAK